MILMTPEEFNAKYTDLTVKVERFPYRSIKTLVIDVLSNDGFWVAGSMPELIISEPCRRKYPNIEQDLIRVKPYVDAIRRNQNFKISRLKPVIKSKIKSATFLKYPATKRNRELSAYTAGIFNGLYHIASNAHTFRAEIVGDYLLVKALYNNGITGNYKLSLSNLHNAALEHAEALCTL